MNISAEEFHIHFISYANIPFKAGIYASDLSITGETEQVQF